MSLINCSKSTFKPAVLSADKRGTSQERMLLETHVHGLFPENMFNYMKDGRKINPRTWLTATRANQRGKLALRGVTLEEQSALLARMHTACPEFFALLLVEEVAADEEFMAEERT